MFDSGSTLTLDAEKGERVSERREITRMARRHNAAGSLYKRGRNWTYRYREIQILADGRERVRHRSVSLGCFRSQRKAEKARDGLLLKLGRLDRPKAAMTFCDFWRDYFVPQIFPTYKPATQALYSCLFKNHIEPALGSIPLCEITRWDVQRFIGEKRKAELSQQTLAHLRNVTSKALGLAVNWEWLESNPARGVSVGTIERIRPARVLTPDEVSKLARQLPEPARTIFVLGVSRGLRIGEIIGLQFSDLDSEAGYLYVRRRVYRGDVGSPKTKNAIRRLQLSPLVTETLRRYTTTARPHVDSPWIFASTAGTYIEEHNIMRRQVEPTCDRLGIQRFGWHCLRHTFSSYSGDQERASLPALQKLLGHSDAQTTLVYMHPFEEATRSILEGLEQRLFAPGRTFGQFDEQTENGKTTIQ